MSELFGLLSLVLPMTCGAFLFGVIYKRVSSLVLVLGAIFGLGWAGFSFYIICLIMGGSPWILLTINSCLIVIFIFLLRGQKLQLSCSILPSKKVKFQRVLAIIIISSYVILIFFFIAISIFHPYGNWDAWMIWNTKGIHLAEGGLSWYLNDSVHSLTHTGYPLLLPSILANCWVIAKNTTTAVPVTVSLLFTLLATGVVSICITEWKGIFLGYVALVAMIITPHFFLEGQSQYADIPLSSFIVSAVVLTILNQRLFAGGFHISYLLVGVFLGFTLLLKNEGALITMCFLVASFLAVVFEKWNWKNLLMIVFGVLPFGVMLFHYKSQVPSQDHLQAIIWDFRLFDQAMSNLPLIAGYYLKNLIKVSEAIILLMFVIVLKPINVGIYSERSSRFVFIFILGVLTGYTTIYFIVSNPEFLLSTSSMRLLMHIFPTLILFVMLNLRVNKTQNFGE